VIGAAVGGLRQIVGDRVSGYLVEGHDPADHADRLLAILRDPARARELGAAGIERARRYTWGQTAREILSVYRELLDGELAATG
jgi:D-inositol-3-phosphate glycosyltransferase